MGRLIKRDYVRYGVFGSKKRYFLNIEGMFKIRFFGIVIAFKSAKYDKPVQ